MTGRGTWFWGLCFSISLLPENTGLLVITVYDSKWVKFVSTAHTEITVNELVRQIWDAEAKSKMPKVVFRFTTPYMKKPLSRGCYLTNNF